MRSLRLNAPVRFSLLGGIGRTGTAGKKTSSSDVEERSKVSKLSELL